MEAGTQAQYEQQSAREEWEYELREREAMDRKDADQARLDALEDKYPQLKAW